MGPYVMMNLIGKSNLTLNTQCIQSPLVSRVIVLLSLSNIQHDWVTGSVQPKLAPEGIPIHFSGSASADQGIDIASVN